MPPYDYGQLPHGNPPYHQPYNGLPPVPLPVDPNHPYPMMAFYPPQQPVASSQYGSMMTYGPKTDTTYLPPAPSSIAMPANSYPMVANGGILESESIV